MFEIFAAQMAASARGDHEGKKIVSGPHHCDSFDSRLT